MFMHGGLHGVAVETLLAVQKALQAKGFNPGKLDGIMGPNTKAAIVAFQKANGLKPDGIVGPLTSAKLFTVETPAPSTELTQTLARMTAALAAPAGMVGAVSQGITDITASAIVKAAGQINANAPSPLAPQDSNASPVPQVYAPPPMTTPISERIPSPMIAPAGAAPNDLLIPALLGVGALLLLMKGKKGR